MILTKRTNQPLVEAKSSFLKCRSIYNHSVSFIRCRVIPDCHILSAVVGFNQHLFPFLHWLAADYITACGNLIVDYMEAT